MHRVRFSVDGRSVETGVWTDRGIEGGDATFDPDEVAVLPPCSPTKVIAVGPNHESNVRRAERTRPEGPAQLELFVKTAPNCLVAHGETAVLENGGPFIYELELGIVIGERCRHVTADEAPGVIDGYTCVNEITNVGLPETVVGGGDNWVRAKAFDHSAPIGPVIADPEDVPAAAEMELRVDGERRQHASRADLLFDGPTLIEEISRYLTLEAGDVIATGSPSGAAPLADGDAVEIRIEGIGTLRHDVRITP